MTFKIKRLFYLLVGAKLAEAVVLVDSLTAREAATAGQDEDIQAAINAATNAISSAPSKYMNKQLQHLDHIRETLGLSGSSADEDDKDGDADYYPCCSVRIKFYGPHAKEFAAAFKECIDDDDRELNSLIRRAARVAGLRDSDATQWIGNDVHDCVDHSLKNSPGTVDHIDEIMSKLSARPSAFEINQAVIKYGAQHQIDPRQQAEIRRQILQAYYGH